MLFYLCLLTVLVISLLLPLYACVQISTPLDDSIDDRMQEEFLKNYK